MSFKDSADFSNATITITFQPDGDKVINQLDVPVPIIDDTINEANEQVFVVELRLVSSENPSSVTIARQTSLCRIIDNDCKIMM